MTEKERLRIEYDAAEYALIEARARYYKHAALYVLGGYVDHHYSAMMIAKRECADAEVSAVEAHLKCEAAGVITSPPPALNYLMKVST